MSITAVRRRQCCFLVRPRLSSALCEFFTRAARCCFLVNPSCREGGALAGVRTQLQLPKPIRLSSPIMFAWSEACGPLACAAHSDLARLFCSIVFVCLSVCLTPLACWPCPRGIRIPPGLRTQRAHPFRLPWAIHSILVIMTASANCAKQLGRATLLTLSVLPEVAFVPRTALAKHGCCATRLEQGATSSCL